MTYFTQLQQQTNNLTIKRKKEYIQFNFGKVIDKRLLKPNCKVLEIGPGLGDFVEYCNDKKVYAVDIIDQDEAVISYISKKYKIQKEYSSLHQFLNQKASLYDIILLTQVLEHIPQEEHISLLKGLYERLSDKGVIIITVPNIGNPLAIFERYYDYTHKTAFTEHSLMQMVDFANFKNVRVTVQPFRIPPYSLINIVRSILQSLLHGIFKLIYIINGGVYPRILTTNITLIVERTA